MPSNYLRVAKLAVPISGQYFINASIPPVPNTVPHVVTGTENLFLHTTYGDITANVWLTGNNKLRRVSMKLHSDDGNIQAKIVRLRCPIFLVKVKVNENAQHDAFSSGKNECRPSLDIDFKTKHGSVYLLLPRFFRGLISTRIQPSPYRPNVENITLSPALEKSAMLLSDVNGARVYLVGDRPRAWMSWPDDNDKKGVERAADSNTFPEEPFDTFTVSHCTSNLRIRWDGELEPEFPD